MTLRHRQKPPHRRPRSSPAQPSRNQSPPTSKGGRQTWESLVSAHKGKLPPNRLIGLTLTNVRKKNGTPREFRTPDLLIRSPESMYRNDA